ncbi:GGDEF domain-containing protein [Roseateles sp. PN1]|uniref:GGDEF domain-containing protein n=1 Tax=Roseateles sp. PN1 TaxID=3137372 RepID=UPI00313A2454
MPDKKKLLKIISIHSEVAQMGLDLGGLMSLVVSRTLELVDAEGAVIELVEGDDLVYRAVSGAMSAQLGSRVKRGRSLSGTCLSEGRSLICEDSETDLRVDLEACRRVGVRSLLVIPLTHAGETVGVLKAGAARPSVFSEEDAQTLELLTNVVGAAMFWATRYGKDDLFYRATHDHLTGLPNRSLFMDRLRLAVMQIGRMAPAVAILSVDMDGLKQINDQYGHAAGDAALVAFGHLMRTAARETDTVARLGGDEFAVILTPFREVDGLSAAIERYQKHLEGHLEFRGTLLHLRSSIGGAVCPHDTQVLSDLIDLADQRMYEAKRRRSAVTQAA